MCLSAVRPMQAQDCAAVLGEQCDARSASTPIWGSELAREESRPELELIAALKGSADYVHT